MIARLARLLLSPLLALLLAGTAAEAQGGARFLLRVAPAAEGWRPLISLDRLLEDGPLLQALESGLPLRLHLRVELWENRLFDRLADAQEISQVLVQDPLDGSYLLEVRRMQRRFAARGAAEAAVEAALRPDLRPSGSGRFYYLAVLTVETFSLTDLEELRRWLRGEVAPALGGQSGPDRAVGTGMRRLLVRVLGLPTRSYEARSGTFTPR